jgi:hypothetical protein
MVRPAGWTADVDVSAPFADSTGTDWWEPARRRALAELDRRHDAVLQDFARPYHYYPGQRILSDAEMHEQVERESKAFIDGLRSIDAAREQIWKPGWKPARPERRMPTLWKLAEYWAARGTFDVLLDDPHCFGCREDVSEFCHGETPKARWNSLSGYLERAHLVARVYDGLDAPQNIVPLCGPCHRLMPDDDGPAAIKWVQLGGWKHFVLARI